MTAILLDVSAYAQSPDTNYVLPWSDGHSTYRTVSQSQPEAPPPPSDDEIGAGTFSLGVNYPGVGLKYFLSDSYALEARGQAQSGDDVGGVRAYRYFRPGRVLLYVGFEADYDRFKGAVSKGAGYGGEVFGGIEYLVAPHVGVQVDFGPAYIELKDASTSLTAGGLEYVMNFGVNYYFGLRERR